MKCRSLLHSDGFIQGFENQLSAQVPPQGAASGAPGALIPPEKKGFANYRRLVLMQMMRGMECCLVIVVQRSGSLLLHWAPLDVSTSGCFDINPSHPFFPLCFVTQRCYLAYWRSTAASYQTGTQVRASRHETQQLPPALLKQEVPVIGEGCCSVHSEHLNRFRACLGFP